MCSPQYSQKEDKYEEEIKVLTDKLKEVKNHESSKVQDGLHSSERMHHIHILINVCL